MQGQVRFFFI
uniref:Uncharacterized protein n=1 Tax=Anguilla anguilla TaxID=7936 RepID=A0A0E9S6S9_ANGAN